MKKEKKIDRISRQIICFNQYGKIRGAIKYFFSSDDKKMITVKRQKKYFLGDDYNPEKKILGFQNVGIVFQGPLTKEDNFTLNSIALIRKNYPDIVLVLSTWKNELTEKERNILNNLHCIIIESESFGGENKGEKQKIAHLNNQILSTKKGLVELNNKGCTYALKVRSDLRIYKIDFVLMLINQLRMVELVDGNKNKLLNVAFSNSFANIPFHMSDFIWFGRTKDMMELYSIPYRTEKELKYIREKVSDKEFFQHHQKLFNEAMHTNFVLDNERAWYSQLDFDEKFLMLFHEEIYVPLHYYFNIGERSGNLMADYYEFLKNKVVVIDDDELQIYWKKSLYSVVQNDYMKLLNNRMTHSTWLNIFFRGEQV